MDMEKIAERLDSNTTRGFVQAARQVIDALLIEAPRVEPEPPQQPRDYRTLRLDSSAPQGGWIGHSELRAASQGLTEAIAAERWTDGFLLALRLVAMLRP